MIEASLVKLPLYIMSLDFTDVQSTLVQVMAWCHRATTHYLSQSWPKSLSPNGVTRPQGVNYLPIGLSMSIFGVCIDENLNTVINELMFFVGELCHGPSEHACWHGHLKCHNTSCQCVVLNETITECRSTFGCDGSDGNRQRGNHNQSSPKICA